MAAGAAAAAATAQLASPAEPLFDFRESEIKFPLRSLMAILRDHEHEGWVLAAYPDPKTSRPLIGAGFSLDVAATDHPQSDAQNPHLFLEPSSVQLWQAAGLNGERLQQILTRFDRNLDTWKVKGYRRRIRARTLTPDVTEEEAIDLLRISAIQAIHNARAYCRNFAELTASQQMALSQLVFQMGTNLEEFTDFLGAMNGEAPIAEAATPQPVASGGATVRDWNAVQRTLIESQWARRYATRASTVIAMFDPNYAHDPEAAEHKISAVLQPAPKHRHKRARSAPLRAANDGGKKGQSRRKLS
jgi:hypothetical protein